MPLSEHKELVNFIAEKIRSRSVMTVTSGKASLTEKKGRWPVVKTGLPGPSLFRGGQKILFCPPPQTFFAKGRKREGERVQLRSVSVQRPGAMGEEERRREEAELCSQRHPVVVVVYELA